MATELEEREREHKRQETKVLRAREKVLSCKKMQSSLHQRIVDLEKVIGDFETEQRRLRVKNETVLTQTIEMETELLSKGLLSQEQIDRFH